MLLPFLVAAIKTEARKILFSFRIHQFRSSISLAKEKSMGSRSEAPSWADQWSTSGGIYDHSDDEAKAKAKGSEKKTGNVKAAASASLNKAKAAATVGAQKVKSGTSVGIKWVKTQYQKRTSK